MQENREQMRHLGFSCQNIEIDIKHNEVYEGHFRIYANNKNAECRIYSSDTRMQLVKLSFNGEVFLVEYRFDSNGLSTLYLTVYVSVCCATDGDLSCACAD